MKRDGNEGERERGREREFISRGIQTACRAAGEHGERGRH